MKDKYEKSKAGEIAIEKSRFAKWFENFWYYYKWHVIVIGFFLIVGLICFVQCATSQNSSDLMIAYVGGYSSNKEDNELICEVLGSVAPDAGESGKGSVGALNYFSVYSQKEAEQIFTNDEGETNTNGVRELLQTSNSNLDQFVDFTKTGEAAVWLVSEDVYHTLDLSERAMPLSALYGEQLPESRYDEYAIRLSETDLYRYYGALQKLPANTLVVMPARVVVGAASNSETYAYFCDMFRAIVEFKMPQ